MTSIETTPVDINTGADNVNHAVCCLDNDRSLCGGKTKGGYLEDDKHKDSPDDCVVCIDIWYAGTWCPLGPSCEYRWTKP